MKTMFLAALTALFLGFGATMTMANAFSVGNSPWSHQVQQDNGQG